MADVHSSGLSQTSQSTAHDSFPLDYDTRDIRLLKIQPGQRSQAVQLQIFTTSLSDPPEYNALSYTWSDEGSDVTVEVGNQTIVVSETLYQALVHLRQPTTESVFWIDAICINQTSTQDKNHQVPLMDKICSAAREVIVWLGNANLPAKSDPKDLSQFEDYLRDQDDTFDVGLIALFQKRWFNRTWILQEAALPVKEPKFLWGPNLFSWSTFICLDCCMRSVFRKRHHGAFCGIHDLHAGLTSLAVKEVELHSYECSDDNCPGGFDPAGVSGASRVPDFGKTFWTISHAQMLSDTRSFEAGSSVATPLEINSFSLYARGILVDTVEHATVRSPRRGTGGIGWTQVLPLFEFLRAHASVSQHESETTNSQSSCASCLSTHSNIEGVVTLANQFHLASVEVDCHKEGDARPKTSAVTPIGDHQSHPEHRVGTTTYSSDTVNVASEPEDLNGLGQMAEKASPLLSNPNVSTPGQNSFDGYLNLDTISPLVPESVQQSRPPFGECGLYRPPIGEPCDFWDAAWRTLVADDWVPECKQRPSLLPADVIRLALHWEALQRDLKSLQDQSNTQSTIFAADTDNMGSSTAYWILSGLNFVPLEEFQPLYLNLTTLLYTASLIAEALSPRMDGWAWGHGWHSQVILWPFCLEARFHTS
ncbi:heterokaryon incompatibility [Fusarium albosuccineum]|uniref:Heterokaryon incompatibility n=1 Tax=Fusarium albosuccineum TaxID=1237068 RepID=A0A8H4L6Q2_9HYPO|nr:heterokaryon incompatibility [Fusarium albosuccineum]